MKSFKEYSISPLSKGTRKHIDRVRDANDKRLQKLRAAKRKKNPTFMDKLKKGFRKEENQIDELSTDKLKAYRKKASSDAVNRLVTTDPKSRLKYGKRLTGMGRASKKLNRRGVREGIEEARKPSDDNFGGAGYSGEKGFKNKAVASRGGQTAGRNRGRAAQRKAQQGMIDAAIKQDKKEFRKHAVAMSKSLASMTKQKEPIQTMWTKEKAKALKDGTWFKMSYQQQKKIEGNKPRFEPFDWGQRESVSEAVSPAQQAAIAIAKKESGKYDKDGKKLKKEACWDGYKQVGTKMKNGKVVPNCVKESIIESNLYRVGSEKYFEYFQEQRKLFEDGQIEVDGFDKELLEGDIGTFAEYEGEVVPLDCPMMEAKYGDEEVELNKPKKGGSKKYYVYVKDPSTGNIKKVSWGDTTGLKVKLNNPEARKSFVARHQCDQKKDKTKAGYWACNLPRYAKQLGLSGGGNFYW